MSEVESKEIIGIWSRGVRILIVGVSFSTVDPEGLLDDSLCLAPSRRSVNIGGSFGGLPRTVELWDPGRRFRVSMRIRRGGR